MKIRKQGSLGFCKKRQANWGVGTAGRVSFFYFYVCLLLKTLAILWLSTLNTQHSTLTLIYPKNSIPRENQPLWSIIIRPSPLQLLRLHIVQYGSPFLDLDFRSFRFSSGSLRSISKKVSHNSLHSLFVISSIYACVFYKLYCLCPATVLLLPMKILIIPNPAMLYWGRFAWHGLLCSSSRSK